MRFIEKLEYQMKMHSMTRPALADLLEIPYTTFVAWFEQRRSVDNIKAGYLRKLSQIFQVPLEYWFDDYDSDKLHNKQTLEFNRKEAIEEMTKELYELNNRVQELIENTTK